MENTPASPFPSSSHRRDDTTKRGSLIRELASRFYINQRGVFITNHLSTELICFPSDLHAGNKTRLDDKIRNAISYATTFRDVESLNALRDIPNPTAVTNQSQEPADSYITLGLYLYLADECSRLGRKKTFLTAMREAKAEQNSDHSLTAEQLYQRTVNALHILNMEEKHFAALKDWHEKAQFTVAGEVHCVNENGAPQGAYAKLAQNVCQRQVYLGMNLPISYALGNRRYIEGLSPEKVYAQTKELIRLENEALITACIDWGNKERERRVRHIIQEQVSPQAPSHANSEFARKILSALPDAALEILLRKGYSIAYASDADLSNAYPEQDIIGVSSNSNHITRKQSYGTVQHHHRTIFICDGHDGILQPLAIKRKGISQTLLHETMHMAISFLSNEEKNGLKKAVESVSNELASGVPVPAYMHLPMETLPTATLVQLADYRAPRYAKAGYYEKDHDGNITHDSRWEEVACNLFARMHTEFSDSSAYPAFTEAGGMPSMHHLAKEITAALNTALARCRAQYPEMKLTEPQLTP